MEHLTTFARKTHFSKFKTFFFYEYSIRLSTVFKVMGDGSPTNGYFP